MLGHLRKHGDPICTGDCAPGRKPAAAPCALSKGGGTPGPVCTREVRRPPHDFSKQQTLQRNAHDTGTPSTCLSGGIRGGGAAPDSCCGLVPGPRLRADSPEGRSLAPSWGLAPAGPVPAAGGSSGLSRWRREQNLAPEASVSPSVVLGGACWLWDQRAQAAGGKWGPGPLPQEHPALLPLDLGLEASWTGVEGPRWPCPARRAGPLRSPCPCSYSLGPVCWPCPPRCT